MSFIVVGRPPGFIHFKRLPRHRRDGSRKYTKPLTVTRIRRLVAAHAVPYDTPGPAHDLLQRLKDLGWYDLAVCHFDGESWIRPGSEDAESVSVILSHDPCIQKANP